jgi:hypothetical protein
MADQAAVRFDGVSDFDDQGQVVAVEPLDDTGQDRERNLPVLSLLVAASESSMSRLIVHTGSEARLAASTRYSRGRPPTTGGRLPETPLPNTVMVDSRESRRCQ